VRRTVTLVLRACGALIAAVSALIAFSAARGGAQACTPPLTIGCPTTTSEPEPQTTTTSPAPTTTTTAQDVSTETTALTFPLTVDSLPTTVDTAPVAPSEQSPPTATPLTRRPVIAFVGITPAAVTGSYGIGVGGVLLAGLVPIAFASRIRRKGRTMNDPRRRWRLLAAAACLVLAALIGLVGYLKLSLEPAVNRQIPYLASAGMALVLLAAVGGSLLVAEQIRADDERIDQLERSVRILAEALGPDLEAPARRK